MTVAGMAARLKRKSTHASVPPTKLAQGPIYEGPPSWYDDPVNKTTPNMITKLPTRPTRHGAGEVACGKGRTGSMTKAAGLGKAMVADLDTVVTNYAAQAKADRRQAALDRLAERAGQTINY
jgi:hypothetical protein